MDLRLSDEQEQLVASFGDLFAKQANPVRVREAEPLGHDPELWRSLGEVGVVPMAVPADRGGWGASMVDLALVAELAGRAVAPAPIVDAQVAARLLASVEGPLAADTLASVLEEGSVVTLALHHARDGRATLVPGGAVANAVLVLDGGRLLLVDATAQSPRPVDNLGSQPLADLDVTAGVELASGPNTVALHDRAVSEWLALTSAALVGIGARATEMAVEYACERRAFGQPIGSFQGISHPLANSATALDGARLLAHKAAWAADEGEARAAELAAMAFAFASETARDATYVAVHTHGGYGFMLEQDVQLYYRRARGWARVWGDPRRAYRRAAAFRYPKAG
jgi:alkylation response protein AidB-like acyl-CoA dehydrogenase